MRLETVFFPPITELKVAKALERIISKLSCAQITYHTFTSCLLRCLTAEKERVPSSRAPSKQQLALLATQCLGDVRLGTDRAS